MNLKEALNIIGLPKSSSADEFKSKYKELAKKYHPDVYKEDPEKFKQINEAYQLIQDYKSNPDKYDRPDPPFGRSPFNTGGFGGFGNVNFEDLFGDAIQEQQSKTFKYPPLNTRIKITFKESVLGADKDIQYKKYMKCGSCNGKGSESISNGCQSCNGFGRIVSNNKGMIFTRICNKCYGKDIKVKNCDKCNSLGVSEVDASVTIHVPPGTQDDSTLRLRNAGHYVGASVFGEAHSDVFVFVNVIPQEGLRLDGCNVVSHLSLSLLDALTGCDKEVNTIFNTRKITIPPGSKNKDEIHIPDCGVKSANGIQRVILEISYPENTKELINFLKDK